MQPEITSLGWAENIHGATRFSFPTLVPLKPGNVYVIEVVDIGVESMAIGSLGEPDSTYPGGTWILKDEEITGNDFWFREGLANSTPQTPAYCKNDLWAYLSRPDGSSYKNQGDCLQYLFTSK